MRPRLRLLAPLLLTVLIGSGCDNAPSVVLPDSTDTTLTASTTALGPVTQVYTGTDAAGDRVTWQTDAFDDLSLSYSAAVAPVGSPAYTAVETFLWTGLTGIGTYFLDTQSSFFADATTPSLVDRDDCSGQLVLPGDGTFTLSLTITGLRYPGGSAPGQTTTETLLFNGTLISTNG
jgi:hypothetical protein